MSRHPLGGALRISEEPSRAAYRAGVERLWSGPFASQNENVGLNSHGAERLLPSRLRQIRKSRMLRKKRGIRSLTVSATNDLSVAVSVVKYELLQAT